MTFGQIFGSAQLTVYAEEEDREEVYDYQFPIGDSICMLPYDSRSIGRSNNCYYQVFADKVVAEPGDKVEIPVVLKKFDLNNPDGQVMQNVNYHLEGTGYKGIILDEIGTGLTIAQDAATAEDEIAGWYIRCIAEMEDEWGNRIYEEVGTPVYICVHNWKETERTEGTCMVAGSVTYQCTKCEGVDLYTEKKEPIKVKGHSEGEWKIEEEATCTKAGKKVQKCTVCGEVGKSETITAKGHTFGEWTTMKEATILKKGVSTRSCTCGATETKSIAKKKGTVKLNVNSITLQVKKSTSAVKVVKFAEGDAVAKWKSSNTRVATVNAKGKIIAKKVGTAKITVTTKSGAKAVVTVKVQKKAVTTKKITVTAKNAVIKKNKMALKKGKSVNLIVTLNPITSTDKVTYSLTAKDKKIISISKSGKLKAKKAGTAKFTVKAGKKKVVITVTVKNKYHRL